MSVSCRCGVMSTVIPKPPRRLSWLSSFFAGVPVGVATTPMWAWGVHTTAHGNALRAAIADGLFTLFVWSATLTLIKRPGWAMVVGLTLGSAVAMYFTVRVL